MTNKLCPALGTECIKEQCLAYIPMQEERYIRHGKWYRPKLSLSRVIIGYCTLLRINFNVKAKEES